MIIISVKESGRYILPPLNRIRPRILFDHHENKLFISLLTREWMFLTLLVRIALRLCLSVAPSEEIQSANTCVPLYVIRTLTVKPHCSALNLQNFKNSNNPFMSDILRFILWCVHLIQQTLLIHSAP